MSDEVFSTPSGYTRFSFGLMARPDYLELSPEKHKEVCNGIGAAKGLSKYIPETIYLLNVSEAGNIHDFDYHIGGTEADRVIADRVFYTNLITIIDHAADTALEGLFKGGWSRWWALIKARPVERLRSARKARARKYYVALCEFGSKHFNHKEA